MTAAERFLAHALALEWSDLPEGARTAAATFLHDTLAVGVAGARAPYAEAVLEAACGWGAGDTCRVLGRPGLRLPVTGAAFLTAFQIHAQEFDCVHEPAVVHPLATVGSVLLAELERSGPFSGEDLLTALAAGVDVAASLGVAATTPLKFFRPATAGIFGSVAAVARLRRLPLDTALDAFGHALAFAGGTMQAHLEGKPALPLQIAHAARGALSAIDLAVAGVPGTRGSIDGPFGYLPLFETASELEPVLQELGRRFRIEEVSWKPFPTGRAAHGGVVAVQTLMRERGLSATNLRRLVYRAPPLIARLVGRPAVAGMAAPYARLCLPYLAAVTLTHGTVGLEDFGPERLADAALQALAQRITVEDDGNPDPAAFVPAFAKAELSDWTLAEIRIDALLGSPSFPLTRQQHLEKARACLAFAGFEAAHEPLAEAILRLPQAADAREILTLVTDGTTSA